MPIHTLPNKLRLRKLYDALKYESSHDTQSKITYSVHTDYMVMHTSSTGDQRVVSVVKIMHYSESEQHVKFLDHNDQLIEQYDTTGKELMMIEIFKRDDTLPLL